MQTTILTPKGTKAPVGIPKITTGALGTGAVRFAAAAEVMGVAEGCETALSAQIKAEIPVWASLGCHRLHRWAAIACIAWNCRASFERFTFLPTMTNPAAPRQIAQPLCISKPAARWCCAFRRIPAKTGTIFKC